MRHVFLAIATFFLLTVNIIAHGMSPAVCAGNLVNGSGVINSRPANPVDETDLQGCAAAISAVPPEQVFIDPTTGSPTCLVIEASGTAKLSGYSVLTTVPMTSTVNGDSALTPTCFPVDPVRGCGTVGAPEGTFPPGSAGLTGFTSRAVLTRSLQGKKYRGTIFTRDTGFITAGGFVGQVLLIDGGTGDFEGASGMVGVAGQEVGGYANYTGSVCVP